MPLPPINTADLESAVTDAEGVEASVIAFINGFSQKITDAVTAALQADAAANQASIDAANGAISTVTDRVRAISSGLATAVTA